MTPRGTVQQQLVDHIQLDSEKWNAPYGVVPALEPLARGGAVRTIAFGVFFGLDAHITIWSPDRIVIDGRGPLAAWVSGTYPSVQAVISKLDEVPQPGERPGQREFDEHFKQLQIAAQVATYKLPEVSR